MGRHPQQNWLRDDAARLEKLAPLAELLCYKVCLMLTGHSLGAATTIT